MNGLQSISWERKLRCKANGFKYGGLTLGSKGLILSDRNEDFSLFVTPRICVISVNPPVKV